LAKQGHSEALTFSRTSQWQLLGQHHHVLEQGPAQLVLKLR
jgi:hypothetical protein